MPTVPASGVRAQESVERWHYGEGFTRNQAHNRADAFDITVVKGGFGRSRTAPNDQVTPRVGPQVGLRRSTSSLATPELVTCLTSRPEDSTVITVIPPREQRV